MKFSLILAVLGVTEAAKLRSKAHSQVQTKVNTSLKTKVSNSLKTKANATNKMENKALAQAKAKAGRFNPHSARSIMETFDKDGDGTIW